MRTNATKVKLTEGKVVFGAIISPIFIPSTDKILRSPMPGRVIAILVRPGDRVSAGDEVCVVEAMKMEQSVRAHQDGVVKTVYVEPMDRVAANAPLVELE